MDNRKPNRIYELRKQKGMTQEQLGKRAGGASKQLISKLENGDVELTVRWMRLISAALKCAPADLLSAEDNPYSLNDIEQDIIAKWRRLPADEQHRFANVVDALGNALIPDEEIAA